MNAAALLLRSIAHEVIDAGDVKATLAPLTREFAPGLLHVIGGPSGSGKTTLLSILSLTVSAAHGLIDFGKDRLSALGQAKATAWRRKHIGMVFQTSRLVSLMTVAEHIKLAATVRGKPEAVDYGIALLDQFGMQDKHNHRPDQLSGGEKQRIALAQALCFRPPILLADEPTAALDQTNAELVAHSLRTYAQEAGSIVICVSHDRALIDAADNLLMLEKP